MRRASIIVLFGGIGCQNPAPYMLSEDDVRTLAANRCRASAECCDDATVAEGCADELTTMILGYEERTDATLTFSEECMSAMLAWSPDIGCGSDAELDDPACALVIGDRSLGETCLLEGDVGFYMTDCDHGLQCLEGHCVDVILLDTQPAQAGELCDAYTSCENGLFCNDGRCEPQVEPGAPCAHPHECGPATEYYCRGLASGQGECVLKAGLGEPCDPRDRAPCVLTCDAEGCNPLTCTEGTCLPFGPAVCEPP